MELDWIYDQHVESLVRALALRDIETETHTRRVTSVALDLARMWGIPSHEISHIRRGALLHDIGKIGIPDCILHKKTSLSNRERGAISLHPIIAYELLFPVPYLRLALYIPYCHHEKWDGTGYPRGLKGSQIPFAARLFAVVDVWDALLSDRPYRPAWPVDKVKDYISAQSGKFFEPDIVTSFLNISDIAEKVASCESLSKLHSFYPTNFPCSSEPQMLSE